MLSFTTEKPLWFIIFCLLLAVGYCFLLYKNEKTFNNTSKFIRYFLYSFRFCSVFILSFLLLSPLIKNTNRKVEKPIVVVAQDNSKSITIGNDSAYYKNEYQIQFNKFIEKIANKYEVKTYLFGDKITDYSTPNYNNKQTDIAGLFDEINTRYSGRNLGALVLATDGIYNEGSNPVYSINNINAPIFSIALGDTNVRKDVLIKAVNSNKYAYLGNTFPVEVVVEAKQFAGKNTKLNISQNGKIVATQNIAINKNNFIATCSFMLPANVKGLNQYTVAVQNLADEITYANNVNDIFIEVLDGKQKVLLLAAAPHPDIAAIRKAIEKNANHDCEVALAENFNKPLGQYSLIILHNLPSNFGANKIVNDAVKTTIPLLFITGTQTNFASFNALQLGVNIFPNSTKFNECQSALNTGFSLFSVPQKLGDATNKFPPLLCPFASYKLSTNSVCFSFQNYNGIVTNNPLIAFNTSNDKKCGFVCGEGLWRWQLADFTDNNTHDNFNELINKTIQYLSAKDDKSLFRISTNNSFNENENIEFGAELYNESYELIPEKEIPLSISNANGKQFNFVFSPNGNTYKLNAGLLPAGKYNYSSKVTVGAKQYTQAGVFTVKSLLNELANTTANHTLLYQLASKTKGAVYAKNNLEKLAQELLNREDIKPVIYSEKQLNDAINLKWILVLLLSMLSLEWFIRKRSGGY